MRVLYIQYFLFLFFLPNIVKGNPSNPLLSSFTKIYNVVSSNLVPPNFLEEASKLGGNAANFVNEHIELLASKGSSVAEGIHELKAIWTDIVTTVDELHSKLNPESLLERQGLVEDFAIYFSTNMDKALKGLQAELEEPLPENQSERYKQQEAIINKILDITEDVLVEACNFVKILHVSEEQIRKEFGHIKSHIRRAILITVTLVENHPYIMRALLVAVAIPILYKLKTIRILRRIARLLGIGRAGPGKGSLAALLQSYFFRGIIPHRDVTQQHIIWCTENGQCTI